MRRTAELPVTADDPGSRGVNEDDKLLLGYSGGYRSERKLEKFAAARLIAEKAGTVSRRDPLEEANTVKIPIFCPRRAVRDAAALYPLSGAASGSQWRKRL